jgi:hypothetical protein
VIFVVGMLLDTAAVALGENEIFGLGREVNCELYRTIFAKGLIFTEDMHAIVRNKWICRQRRLGGGQFDRYIVVTYILLGIIA